MDLSPFYRWPQPISGGAGALLRIEPVAVQDDMAARAAYRILYASTDARWNSGAVPVSGMLFLPRGEPPEGGWPLLAWAHGTAGIADACAPSWTGVRPRDATYMSRWLEAGFAVVATDYQGLGGPGPHPYLDWRSEGRSVLDSVRAALAAKPEEVSNRVILAGQSQGSGAAVGAAMLVGEYAPRLGILGTVATGFGYSFPDGPVSLPERRSATQFLSYASSGLRDDAPPIDDIVTPAGRQLLEAARQGCKGDIVQRARELKVAEMAQAFSIPMEAVRDMAIPVADMPVRPTGRPLLIATGLADATTIPERQYANASAMCAAGDTVIWRTYDGLGHDGAMHGSLPDSIAFARSLLAGREVASECGSFREPGPPGARNPDAPFNDD
ncbi:lipase [Sphingosinithalassobacter tenebrarum]|uniref:Lipase n=2 Tax=Stakelama tenebrarum TaxID=2711215 RepID=A0A6G6Y9X4_9SPHN|nr:lipase [Sphingosinithalassobacter tenebrarum]